MGINSTLGTFGWFQRLTQKTLGSTLKALGLTQKTLIIYALDTCIDSKDTCIDSEDTWIYSKDTWISRKDTCWIGSWLRCGLHEGDCHSAHNHHLLMLQ